VGAVRLGGLVTTTLVVPRVGGGSLATVVEAIDVTVVWLTVEMAGLIAATRLWPPPPQPVSAVTATARQNPLVTSRTGAPINQSLAPWWE
jgi:hypothetical protein